MAQQDEFEELRDDYAEKQARIERRRLEKLWAKTAKFREEVGQRIECRWFDDALVDGKLVEGQDADCEVIINGEQDAVTVPCTFKDLDGEHKRRTKDYRKFVEGWALWKWHKARGTIVSERDVYSYEPGYEPPTFVWDKPAPAKTLHVPHRAAA